MNQKGQEAKGSRALMSKATRLLLGCRPDRILRLVPRPRFVPCHSARRKAPKAASMQSLDATAHSTRPWAHLVEPWAPIAQVVQKDTSFSDTASSPGP